MNLKETEWECWKMV